MEKAYLKNIALDVKYQSLVIMIGIEEQEKYLPIWIGNPEAFAIALGKSKVKTQRPMTHDLLVSVIDGLGGKIEKVILTGLKNDTYFAFIHIKQDEQLVVIDARPSDSIALALKVDAPIYISEEIEMIDPQIDTEKHEKISNQLKIIKPEDLLSM
ncbi:MAG: bifunctional nuclease family protein [Candidatus Zixiibacteriota bacterium]